MTTISAKVIEDSIYQGSRLTTLQLRYPRFIHSEFMTHRVFSRNASSSRAIPVEKMIDRILEDPAMPIHWGKNQPGMQAREENDRLVVLPDPATFVTPEGAWMDALEHAVGAARAMHEAGYHKQIVNRLLEPFMHIDVVCTATEFDNFFELRRHEDAQPEIKALADQMWAALKSSTPKKLQMREWHLPYISQEERASLDIRVQVHCSVARCARVSYLMHDGTKPSIEKDIILHDFLLASDPKHASPAEHQATPERLLEFGKNNGNFSKVWTQYRQIV